MESVFLIFSIKSTHVYNHDVQSLARVIPILKAVVRSNKFMNQMHASINILTAATTSKQTVHARANQYVPLSVFKLTFFFLLPLLPIPSLYARALNELVGNVLYSLYSVYCSISRKTYHRKNNNLKILLKLSKCEMCVWIRLWNKGRGCEREMNGKGTSLHLMAFIIAK